MHIEIPTSVSIRCYKFARVIHEVQLQKLCWPNVFVSILTVANLVYTVEPPVSGQPRDQIKCPFKRGVRLWEVKNVVFVCS